MLMRFTTVLGISLYIFGCGAEATIVGGPKDSGDTGATGVFSGHGDTGGDDGDTAADPPTPDNPTTTSSGDTGVSTGEPTGDTGGSTTGGSTTGVEDPTGGTGNDNDPPPFSDGPWVTHVISVHLPPDVTSSACDANGDGVVNEADGQVNALIGIAQGLGQDLNASIMANIVDGSTVLLAELAGYLGGEQSGFDVHMFVGDVLDADCYDYNDDGTHCPYQIDPKSYGDDGELVVQIPSASVKGNELSGGPTDFQFPLQLGDIDLNVTILKGRMLGEIEGQFDLVNGRLCGMIGKDNLQSALDTACSTGGADPQLCDVKDVVVALLDCAASPDPNLCSLVIELEGVEAASLAPAP